MNGLKIRGKLLLMLLGVCLPAMAAVAWLGYSYGESAISRAIFNQLTSIRAAKAYQIESYFRGIRAQVQTLSEDRMVVDAIKEFRTAYRWLPPPRRDSEARQREFYSDLFYPVLRSRVGKPRDLAQYLPTTSPALYLQDLYVVTNPYPIGQKELLMDAGDGSAYSGIHTRYHKLFLNLVDKFGYYDLFLIDSKTGDVIYSVFKEIDFATNLLNGPHRHSNLAGLVKLMQNSSEPQQVMLVDFAAYDPSYGAPASFIASPVFDGDEQIGVLAFQMPDDEINRVMTGDQNWVKDGLGQSGETYLVGADYLMRSNSRFIVQDPEAFRQTLADNGAPQDVLKRMYVLGTTVLHQKVATPAIDRALGGETGTAIIDDYRGVPVLSAFTPLDIEDVTWALASEIDEQEAFAPVRQFSRAVLIATLAIIALTIAAAIVFSGFFVRPLRALMTSSRLFAAGDSDPYVTLQRNDEFGELGNTLNDMMRSIEEQTRAIQQKNEENERLLLNILPGPIADRLRAGEDTIADSFPDVTILFADIVGFTSLSEAVPAARLVEMLNELFSEFDEMALQRGIEKIKTIGDAYMVVAGIPRQREDHAEAIMDMAIAMCERATTFGARFDIPLSLRVGINSGPVVAGVIGTSKFIYDLWGDAVNLASRMESHGLPGCVHLTEPVYEALKHRYDFTCRGEIDIKGKGRIVTYMLDHQQPEEPLRATA